MNYQDGGKSHASGLTAAALIRLMEFQNQQAVQIRSLTFWPVDGRPHPVSRSMGNLPQIHYHDKTLGSSKWLLLSHGLTKIGLGQRIIPLILRKATISTQIFFSCSVDNGHFNISDGCTWLPDQLLNYEACVIHDLCYITPGLTKSTCDEVMQENINLIYCNNVNR